MVRTFIIAMFLSTAVWANDIYVDQASNQPPQEETNPAFQQPSQKDNSEKALISAPQKEFCSVIAGCYEVK
jgi:hypothetical protein